MELFKHINKILVLFSFVALYIVLSAPISLGAWQNIGGDPVHSGFADTAPIPLELRWKYKIGGPDISAPVVNEGVLFIGSDDNNLYAIDVKTGKLKWSFPTQGKVYTPTSKDSMIFAASFDNYIYALDIEGDLEWKYNTASSMFSPPVAYENVLYGGFDKYAYAIYINNGSIKWKYETEGFIGSTPAIAQGIVYFGSNDNYIYAIDYENQSLVWKKRTNRGISSSPAVVNGKVYIGSDDNNFYVFDMRDGTLKWSKRTNGRISSSPAIIGKKVYIGSEDTFLYAFSIDNGDIIWKFQTNDRIDSSPIVTRDLVYVGSRDGTIYILDHDGKLVEKYDELESGIKSLALSDNMLFAVTQNGYVSAFGAPDPREEGTAPVAVPDNIPPVLKIDTIPSRVSSGKFVISGRAQDQGGILVVIVNGTKAGSTDWNATLALSPGSNLITITAIDRAGNIKTEMRTVVYEDSNVYQERQKLPGFEILYGIIAFSICFLIKKYNV
ncbi:MAG: hypothetical protein FIB07_10285 [Candidatus Methanoperedens sp.]|nr:hypothetical protein [Candidatus Methanoperedens sp.]